MKHLTLVCELLKWVSKSTSRPNTYDEVYMSLYSQKQTNTLERSAFMLCQALKVKGQLKQEVWCKCAISESSPPLSTLSLQCWRVSSYDNRSMSTVP